jgi:transcription factor C subunit 7
MYEGISEWYSPVAPGSGLHPRPGSAASLQQYFPEIDPSWSSIYYPSRRGEEIGAIHDRAETFLHAFIPYIERTLPEEQHSCVMLVSHAATSIVLARALAGDRDLPLRVGCCTITEFVRQSDNENSGTWKATRLADGSSLSGGAARDWGFEDVKIADGKVIYDPGLTNHENDLDEPVGLQIRTSKM